MKHKASLQMFDNICNLVNEYTSSPKFLVNTKLHSRKSFLRSIEGSYRTQLLRPNNQNVRLHDGTIVTVPVFDTKAMLTSLLTDQTLMVDTNVAEGYNVLAGGVDANNPSNDMYGEEHTGDAWIPARDRYCSNPQGPTMPVGIIVYGDKSHTNLHGTLSLAPIIFTLTLTNQTARNNTRFWRPIGYIPNLSYGKGTSDRQRTSDKIQDKHICLSCIFESLRRITKKGGFDLCVLGQNVTVKIWIHYFIGDTEGNNKWHGQYPGNRDGVQHQDRDFKCTFKDSKHTYPNCVYITLDDIHQATLRKQNDDDGGKQYFKSVSRYDMKMPFLNDLCRYLRMCMDLSE
jgi:hypothetical protein